MDQAHLSGSGKKASVGQMSPVALVEMEAAYFNTFRSATRCWLAIAQAQATAGFDIVARIASANSGHELHTEMNEDDVSNMTPDEEVKLLHIME